MMIHFLSLFYRDRMSKELLYRHREAVLARLKGERDAEQKYTDSNLQIPDATDKEILLERHQLAVRSSLTNPRITQSELRKIYLGDFGLSVGSVDSGVPVDGKKMGNVIWKKDGDQGVAGCYVKYEQDQAIIWLDKKKMKKIRPEIDDIPTDLELSLDEKLTVDS